MNNPAFHRALASMSVLAALGTQTRPPTRGRGDASQTVKRDGHVGRNDPCPCGSGKKFKKCHGQAPTTYHRDPAKKPRPKVTDTDVTQAAAVTTAPADKNATAAAMLHAGVNQRLVWAYLETGAYVTEANKASHPPATIAKWEAALIQYDQASDEEKLIMLGPATT